MSGAKKIRLSRRVLFYLDGSSAGQGQREADPEMHDWLRDVVGPTKARADGSVLVPIDLRLADALYGYVDAMAMGAADGLGGWDEGRDALADLNAARSCLRALVKLGVSP